MTVTRAQKGGWQGCHYHVYTQELYVVQRGEILVAHFAEDGMTTPFDAVYFAGDSFSFEPGVVHDVCTKPGSLFITIKTRLKSGEGSDRVPAPGFDEIVSKIQWP